MGGLFALLQDRVDSNAQRAVDVHTAELPDFRVMATRTPVRSAMLDFAVLLRRREAELAADGAPFLPEDLAVLSAFGVERGRQGVSLTEQRQVMVLHSTLTLREIQEAAGPNEIDHLMHMLGWLPTNGLAAKVGALAEVAALASRVGQVSPQQTTPTHLSTVQDMFVELGVMALPRVDAWLIGLAQHLSTGPDLVHTLDVFYRHDMNRLITAGELRIHPRTLDYRLHRVRELTGIEPGSTRGVRTFSTAVARPRAQ